MSAAGEFHPMPCWTCVERSALASISPIIIVTVKGSPAPPNSAGTEGDASPSSARPRRFSVIGSFMRTRPFSRMTPIASTSAARGAISGDVPAREVEHLAPGRHGPGHVGAWALHRADDARPGDHLVEDLDEIRI